MKKTIYTLAYIHLSLIMVVILHGLDSVTYNPWLEKPLGFLCSVNYSVWQYGFFSPDVGKSSEIELTLFEDGGRVNRFSTVDGFEFYTSNQESLNRFYGFKHNTAKDSVFQDLCARSVAARMLNTHPSAWRLDYVMRSISFPELKNYTPESKIDTLEFYSTSFVLRQSE